MNKILSKMIGSIRNSNMLANKDILRNGMKPDGSIDLSDTDITSIPRGLKVNGHLDISRTKITRLPENLEVSGHINLMGTGITDIPKSLSDDTYLLLDQGYITAGDFRGMRHLEGPSKIALSIKK